MKMQVEFPLPHTPLRKAYLGRRHGVNRQINTPWRTLHHIPVTHSVMRGEEVFDHMCRAMRAAEGAALDLPWQAH